jgi:hypothetical protein
LAEAGTFSTNALSASLAARIFAWSPLQLFSFMLPEASSTT